ncbi:lipopolysaccharide biosynthesis protein [Mycobacterium sp. smrl_JER01]|uniref:lipopolysaccharide biosynthesis protein n=1 Tax=Mycobacterium sp. smrl_JER01 TaxID=3402633 RepID=UPI003ACF5DA1
MQAFTVLFGRSIFRLAQFVAFLIFARILSPEEFGWFGIITTAMLLAATLGSLGLRQSIAYEIGQRRLSPSEALGTALLVWPVLTLLSASVVFFIYGRDLPNHTTAQALGIIFVGVGGAILLMMLQGKFLGSGAISAFSLSESMPRVALMLSSIGLLLLGAVTLQNALWAHVLGYAVTLPVAFWLASRGIGRMALQVRKLVGMLRYGVIFAVNLLLITLCTRVSMFIIEHLSGAAAAGEFFAAVRVHEIFLEIATALGMVLFSNAARREEGTSVIGRSARIACWMFWAFMGLAGFIALAAPLVLTSLIGVKYAAAGPILQILALSLAPAAACKIIYPTLAGSGRPAFGTPIIIACLLANVGLTVVLVPDFGAIGGAVALVVGQYILFAGYILICRYRMDVPVAYFLIPRLADARRIARSSVRRFRRR